MTSTLGGFIRKELKQALREPRMRLLLFLMPVVQLTLFGVALSNEVKNVRLWAPIEANDTVLRHVYDRAVASGWFLPAEADRNADPIELLRAGRIDAALVPPPGGLTRELGRGTANLQLLLDATNVLEAQSIEGYVRNIVARVVHEDLEVEPPESPIRFDTRVLYNPTLETAYFMVPGVMAMLMIVTSLVLTSMSITREKELGTFEMLISAPVTASEVILGKTVPYVVLGMATFPLILGVAVFGFGVPVRGSLPVLGFAALVFVCTAVAIGTLISTFAQNQQQSMLGAFLFLFPAILLSGLMFPVENMPEAMKWMSYVNPVTHFLALLRNILLKGGELVFVAERIGVLLLMAVVSVYVSFKRFHTTLQ
ncbi:ABC transporter permease [Sulfurifustis variabilis]|uniref:ABC transporter permease n=1 Tax=Sulfurifustis variabilis TaxID=1675686 RepID=A0A1B4V477_9GAMM|nr:ABC transporter permease [Sulfurifustis variabilis]BAU48338.1 ABC transporter permease [Sulfurifustis variabilis]